MENFILLDETLQEAPSPNHKDDTVKNPKKVNKKKSQKTSCSKIKS